MCKIKLSKSSVGELEKKALSDVINDAYLGMGKHVQQFEKKLNGYFCGRNVVCVNTGTSALHLSLMAIGLKPGDEVLIQSLTYVASFQAISATGAIPVPCEIDQETCTIDLEDAQKKVSSKTKAIMPVHYASRVGNYDGVYEFAKKHGLRVVEDAAHAFGTVHKGVKVGSIGDVVCFSFDGIKNITCGEGGAVVTEDKFVVDYVSDARLLGVQKDTEKRYNGLRSWEFDVSHQGYRYHMSNLMAAIGITQLDRFESEFKPHRQALAKRYHHSLEKIKSICLFPDNYSEIVPHIFPIKILNGKRDELKTYLQNNDIECGIHYYPNHLLTFYGKRRGYLPVTEGIYSQLLTLPLHNDISDCEQAKVIKATFDFFNL